MKILFYIFSLSNTSLFLMCTLESHSRLLYLTSEKTEIEYGYNHLDKKQLQETSYLGLTS
jgi:hypothetical protein